MALKLLATYSKKVGLPAYSSHQFSLCVEAEISSVADVAEESNRLYRTLQQSVDEEIQHSGYVPDTVQSNGKSNGQNGNGSHAKNGHGKSHHCGNGSTNGLWTCTEKQQALILQLIDDNGLNKAEIEDLAVEMFEGKGVKVLTKIEASGLIEEMIKLVGQKSQRRSQSAHSTGRGR